MGDSSTQEEAPALVLLAFLYLAAAGDHEGRAADFGKWSIAARPAACLGQNSFDQSAEL